MKLVRTVPVDALPFVEPKTGTELILNIGAAALHARAAKPDLSGCKVMTDGEGVALESNKPFSFTCCDCGLTHRCVIVSEDGKPVGFAVERDQETTAQRRATPKQINGKPWDCAKCGHPILADLVWGETAGAFHAECRRPPPIAGEHPAADALRWAGFAPQDNGK
jgi:hypothetical protein